MAGEQILTQDQVLKAWKDDSYRDSLTAEQRDAMPAKPEGDLTDDQLAEAAGGIAPIIGAALITGGAALATPVVDDLSDKYIN